MHTITFYPSREKIHASGLKVPSMRLLRYWTGLGLLEAKCAIENMCILGSQKTFPVNQSELDAHNVPLDETIFDRVMVFDNTSMEKVRQSAIDLVNTILDAKSDSLHMRFRLDDSVIRGIKHYTLIDQMRVVPVIHSLPACEFVAYAGAMGAGIRYIRVR